MSLPPALAGRKGSAFAIIGADVRIGDRPLSIFEINDLVASSERIELSDAAMSRIIRARTIVENYAAGDEPVYGLNTGLGGNIAFRIEPDAIQAFQNQLVVGRNIGVGDPLPE